MSRPKAAALALGGSFAIYLIPVVTPHAAWFLGQVLFHAEPGFSGRWLATNLAVALAIQLAAAVLLYWLFRRRKRGGVVAVAVAVVVAAGVVVLAVQRLYLGVIPAMFLEEPDVAPERIDWPAACSVPGFFQTSFATPSELWIRRNNQPGNYAVLTMPGCRLAEVNLPRPTFTPGGGVNFMIDITAVLPRGRAVVERHETKSGSNSWWMIPGASSEASAVLVPLEPPVPHPAANAPVLSNDGEWVAWLDPIAESGPPVLYQVVLKPRDGRKRERVIDLSGLGPATYVLKSVDMESQQIALWKTDGLISAGFDGSLQKEFPRPRSVRPQQNTYLAAGDHWLAWDAYRDNEPYRLEWSLPAGAGSQRVPLGRAIHSAAVDASGRWIAVSVGTSLNIGSARDAVYVFGAADGTEVFRKYLPVYDRSPVAFLEGGFFCYSDLSGVHVLQIRE